MAPPFPAPLPLAADPNEMTLASGDEYGGLYFARKDVAALGIKVVLTKPPVKWQIKMTNDDGGNLQAHPATKVIEVEDVLLVLGYEWE